MQGNFIFQNATKLIFGDKSLDHLAEELSHYGNKILFVFGCGSIKQNGLYEKITHILRQNNKVIIELGNISPNPSVEMLNKGINIARKNRVDFILAVGGGSVIDYAKALSASINFHGDPWIYYFVGNQKEEIKKLVPVGCVLTMSGTGSEMNSSSVITNVAQKKKISHQFSDAVNPKFAILNPLFTFSVPYGQMVAGIFDSFTHLMEQYFSPSVDHVNDYMMEGLMRSIISSSLVAIKNPRDYEARSNLMWASTWALNTLFRKGKKGDWKLHRIGHGICVATNAPHGYTLSAITKTYYHFMLPYGLPQFKRFAINVFNVNPRGRSDEEIANEGLVHLEFWMDKLGVVKNLRTLGVNIPMAFRIAENLGNVVGGGFKDLSQKEIEYILIKSI